MDGAFLTDQFSGRFLSGVLYSRLPARRIAQCSKFLASMTSPGRVPPVSEAPRRCGERPALLNDALRGRVVPFDERAARRYADVITRRERAGRPIGVPGAQIAAICRELGAVLSTRDVKDFEETGVELADPWQSGAQR